MRTILVGLLRDVSARVNVVNAFLIAEERGITVNTSYRRGAGELVPSIQTRVVAGTADERISGTIFGHANGRHGRITEINGFRIEAIPQGHMLVMHNRDVPGVIGRVGTILGEGGINISAFHLGRRERGGEAMALIELDAPVPNETLQTLLSSEGILSVRQVKLY